MLKKRTLLRHICILLHQREGFQVLENEHIRGRQSRLQTVTMGTRHTPCKKVRIETYTVITLL